MNRGKR